MADIFHDFVIQAPIDRVFQAVSTPQGLDCWWTQKSAGEAAEGNELELYFGSGYDWRAKVTRSVAPSDLELEMVRADDDWKGTAWDSISKISKAVRRRAFTIPGGRTRTSIGEFRVTAGPCIFGSCVGMSSMERSFPMKNGWKLERWRPLGMAI